MNIIMRLEFELAYNYVEVQHVNRYAPTYSVHCRE